MTKTAPSIAFDRFVGVDWSGARGPRLSGLQVAMATAGRCPPRLVSPPDGRKHWIRSLFADWLVETLSGNGRVLVGLDFAFSFPRRDTGEFFPGTPDPDAPSTACGLWRRVDDLCEATGKDFFAGAFVEKGWYAPYFLLPGKRGARYEHRLRMTDERCRDMNLGRPETVFKLVGPTQVGKGSLAGMRVLCHLRRKMPRLCIWPFDRLPKSRSVAVAVEVYPNAFVRMSKVTSGKVGEVETLDRILELYDSKPLRDDVLKDIALDDNKSDDNKTDALIVAAALRRLSRKGEFWSPPGLCDARRSHEGWIFGVA